MNYIITQYPHCGFGNRILYYNNLRQSTANDSFYSVPWEGMEHFKGNLIGDVATDGTDIISDVTFTTFPFCLGELFFRNRNIPTRDIFKLKSKPTIEGKSVAIHFRGTDFFSWNPDAVLDADYYLNALEEVDADKYYLFTDDLTLPSYQRVLQELQGKIVIEGNSRSARTNYIQDFSTMTECDYIISSPSTFCICAGFIGKHKKIIHSEKWVKDRVQKVDNFWYDLYNGGNEDYSLYKLI